MKLKEKKGIEYNTVIYNIQWETENNDLPSEVQHDFFLEDGENIEDEIYSFLMQLSNGVAPLGYQIEMNSEEYYYQPDEDYWEDEEVVSESTSTKEDSENYWDEDDDIDDPNYLNLEKYLKDIENTLDKKYPGLDEYYTWVGIDDEDMLKFYASTYNAENVKNTLNVIKTYFKKQNIPFATDVVVDRQQHTDVLVLVNADQYDDNFLRGFTYKWFPKNKEESLTEDNFHPLAKKLGAKLLPPKEKAKPRYTYEVYWFNNEECDGDPIFKTFYSKKKAQEWYDAHCNDADKFCMDEPYGSRVDEAYSNKEIDRRVNQRQRYLNHLKQQENDVKIPWTVFTFEDGSNPYVVKTQKELDRMLKKYDDRVKQVGENEYRVLSKVDESLNESREKVAKDNNGKDVWIDTAYGDGYQVCQIDGFGNYNPWQKMDTREETINGETYSFVTGYKTLNFKTREEALDFIKKEYGEDSLVKNESLNEASSINAFTPAQYDINEILEEIGAFCGYDEDTDSYFVTYNDYANTVDCDSKEDMLDTVSWLLKDCFFSRLFDYEWKEIPEEFYDDYEEYFNDCDDEDMLVEYIINYLKDIDGVRGVLNLGYYSLHPEELLGDTPTYSGDEDDESLKESFDIAFECDDFMIKDEGNNSYSLWLTKREKGAGKSYSPTTKEFNSVEDAKKYAVKYYGKDLKEARDYESEYNITPVDRRKIIQWWKDLKNYFDEYHTDYDLDLSTIDSDEIDGWFISMADELQDLVDEKQNAGALDLLRRGKSLYNKYAYGSFRYGVKESNKQGCPTIKESPTKVTGRN